MDKPNVHIPQELQQAQRLAQLLDNAIRIPIIGYRVGWDFLIGLIPGAGDIVMALIGARMWLLARRMGAPGHIQRAMIRNLVLDALFGLIPLVGDLIDLFFKANQTNVRMLERWWNEQHQQALKAQTGEKMAQWSAQQQD
ncbi:DUF4112 domain-containing protein [Aestuariibacter halophilus]|uniref:DUF4112 domain-containing protein n=1 Tax=Fluctibacter halophilus TaxID=226011 RepID=A0ABS8GB07_9ALTE|nr:DUF4112 domain-containing protein [Aestuariibacter halophilus]MCC2617727.1 DUF4112 domain-containing protein [Aestuariibacter halophilus]